MTLMQDMIQYLEFCEDMIYEMKDTKSSDYKVGIVEGLEMATSMLRDYLEAYPDFVDPKAKYEKFKK
jgi:hypothetical protein